MTESTPQIVGRLAEVNRSIWFDYDSVEPAIGFPNCPPPHRECSSSRTSRSHWILYAAWLREVYQDQVANKAETVLDNPTYDIDATLDGLKELFKILPDVATTDYTQ